MPVEEALFAASGPATPSQQWAERTSPEAFDAKKRDVLRLKSNFDQLPALKTAKLDVLRKTVKQAQLAKFLDRFEIDKAKIDGIGDGRKRTLQSYGIETAADLLSNAVEMVPGFGPRLCGELYSWRMALEAKFTFNPATGIDRRDIDKVEHEAALERRKLEQAARSGHEELKHLHDRTLAARSQLRASVEEAYASYLQAEVNYKAVSD